MRFDHLVFKLFDPDGVIDLSGGAYGYKGLTPMGSVNPS